MTDLGAEVGIRGPSLYKHVASKQEVPVDIMTTTMDALMAAHRAPVASTTDPTEQLRRAVEAHVRYHSRHRREAFAGNREIRSLVESYRSAILDLGMGVATWFRDGEFDENEVAWQQTEFALRLVGAIRPLS